MKKLISLVLALALVLLTVGAAFAQTEHSGKGGSASITISNAANGETYSVYKLFNASVTGTENGSIAYTGTIPNALSSYFTQDAAGNITATDAAWANAETKSQMSDGLKTALKTWTSSATAEDSAVSDGSVLTFDELTYGYYVVTTTQGDQAITVDSTNPSATIVDKNTTTPNNLTKTVDDDNVYIGQTVTYTVTYNTANYDGAGENAKQIISYTVHDTLPSFLTDVTVTNIYVDNDHDLSTTSDQSSIAVQQFDATSKSFTIPWVNSSNQSIYKNGTMLVVVYTAKVTASAAIAGEGNTNTVDITWKDRGDDTNHGNDHASETIFTYALAIKKVSITGAPLSGATFQFPFYVNSTPASDGSYIYAGTTPGEGLTNSLTTPANGEITIRGLESGTAVSVTETAAPAGYNKLTSPVSVTPVKTSAITTLKSWEIDENGNPIPDTEFVETHVTYVNNYIAATPIAVVNKTGTELPSTGGIGTTIFYIVGGMLLVGAAIVLVARRKAQD